MFWMIWLWGSLAVAADNLIWKWDQSAPIQYEIDMSLRTPFALSWIDLTAGETTAFEHQVNFSTSCVGAAAKKGWKVSCSLDAFEIAASAVLGKTEMMPGILKQHTEMILGKSIELVVAADGRIKQLDFSGIDTKDGRQGAAVENLRQILRRAFVPFDIQMPKDGIDKGKPWKQKGAPMALSLFGASGTSGGVDMKRRVVDSEENGVTMSMEARGSMAFGDTMGSGLAPIMKITSKGRTQFNTKLGVLDWAEVTTKSSFSSSSVGSMAMARPGTFRVRVKRVGAASGAMLNAF